MLQCSSGGTRMCHMSRITCTYMLLPAVLVWLPCCFFTQSDTFSSSKERGINWFREIVAYTLNQHFLEQTVSIIDFHYYVSCANLLMQGTNQRRGGAIEVSHWKVSPKLTNSPPPPKKNVAKSLHPSSDCRCTMGYFFADFARDLLWKMWIKGGEYSLYVYFVCMLSSSCCKNMHH